ncbi:MAG: hypothetical protein KGJ89_03130 [Patescibacteria group bacterium]|nr:hypothetical protein [Patescibacteria group bacterium]MDE2015456.1 hypothetical protein [Patescibacteria group bacterium]MDE2226928.1 hypothetical protein [Patescibacteria group bacterium]
MSIIRIALKQEEGISKDPARVLIYKDNELLAEVIAEIELKRGADNGFYNCVTLKPTISGQSYSCNLCGTTTPLPHICPAFYPGAEKNINFQIA